MTTTLMAGEIGSIERLESRLDEWIEKAKQDRLDLEAEAKAARNGRKPKRRPSKVKRLTAAEAKALEASVGQEDASVGRGS